MKLFVFALILAVCGAIMLTTPSYAQLEIGGDFVTDYVWRGDNILDGNPAIQPSINYPFAETGVTFNVWGSFSLADRDVGSVRKADEMDITLSYDHSHESMDISMGFIHYNFFQNDDWPDENTSTYEVYLGLGMNDLAFLPSLTIYFDPNEKGGDGMYVSLSAGGSWETNKGLTVNESISIGYMDQSYIRKESDAGISDINYSIGTSLNKGNMSLSPTFTFTYIPDKDYDPDHFIFWGSLGIGWSSK